MLRRHFLKSLSLAAGGLALSPGLLGRNLQGADSFHAFHAALEKHPALLGYTNIENDFPLQSLKIEGKVPASINGAFYRIGPARHERDNIRYQHLFEGDGMLQEFYFRDGNISHRGKFVRTPKFVAEEAAGRFLYDGPETRIENGLGVSSPDTVNVSNTNVIPIGKKSLWTLWEGGSAMEVDRQSLNSSDFVNLGAAKGEGNKLAGLPFSAHPKVDPSGDIWNFGVSSNGFLILYHLNAAGQLNKFKALDAGFSSMLHDFLITEKHLLIILPSIVTDRSKGGYFSQQRFDSNLPMKVLQISKHDFSIVNQWELPAAFVFHFGNAWEEKNGTVHFDACMYSNLDILYQLSDIMSGDVNLELINATTTFFTLHSDGRHSASTVPGDAEFPRVNDRKVGHRNHKVFTIGASGKNFWADSIRGIDTDSGSIDQFNYGSEFVVEEHSVIAINDKENYLLGTALHLPSQRSCVNLFRAEQLAEGPIMRAWLPYFIPLGFHGNFVANG